MAFYQKVPQKKRKTDYAAKDAWEEEGSRYHHGDDFEEKETPGHKSTYNMNRRPPRIQSDNRFSSSRRQSPPFRRDDNGDVRPLKRNTYRGRDQREDYAPNHSGGQGSDRLERKSRVPVREKKPVLDRKDPESTRLTPRYTDYEYKKPENMQPEPEQDHILCGRNPIREALRTGREIEKLLVQKGELSGSAREIVQTARAQKILVQEVDKRRMDEIALHHQGLIAFASAYAYATVEDILAEADKKQESPFIIMLDGVTDPHNLGAIIRTAECVGAHGVIIPQHRSVGLTPAAVKASAGAIEHIRVARVTNLNRTIEDLKRNGIWTYAVTMDGKDYEKVDFHGGTALVIGAEGEGISRLTTEKCDLAVSLPMKGALDSLNASVAAGIIMYRVLSCRRKA